MGGDPEAGHASAERMLEAARRAGSGFEASAAVGFMAWALVQGVTPVAAALERCDELAGRFAGDRVARLEVAGFRAVLEAMAGRFDEARAGMAGSREGLTELGLRQACAYMALFDAQLETLAGDAAAAERAVRDAERITAETGDRWFQATVRVDLAHALLRQGAWRDAAAAVDEIDALPAPSDAEWVVKRLGARALLAAHRGALDEALDHARAAASAADVTKLLTFRADAHRTLAEVLALAGDGPAAESAGREALRLYEAKGNAAAAARPISVGVSSSLHAAAADHSSYCSGVQPRSPARSCHTVGWLIAHRMSAARSTSRPGRSAPFSARLSTIARWFARYSVPIRAHSSSMSPSTAAADRITSITAPRRIFPARELRAFSRSWPAGSGSSSTSRYGRRSAIGASPSSPRRRAFHSARSTPAFVSNATYTVLSDTPAPAAIAAIVVAA